MKYKFKLKSKEIKALVATLLVAKEAIDQGLMPKDNERGEEIFTAEEAEKFFWLAYNKLRPLAKKDAARQKEKAVKTTVININADEMPPEVAELLANLGLTVPQAEAEEAAEASPEPETQEGNA